MSIEPAVIGWLAAIMAAVQVCAWLALGSCFLRAAETQVTVPLALLIGSALTAFLYALLAWMGQVGVALGVVPGISLAVLLWRYQCVWQLLRYLGVIYGNLWATQPWVRWAGLATVALYWVVALGPPREADVLRYHLEHIRQIDVEGAWQPIRNYHYAMPFGWSLTYLPFEHVGLPQVAQMLNLSLFLLAVVLLYDVLHTTTPPWLALRLCALFLYHPYLLRAATTAGVDMYGIFVMLTVMLLAIRLPQLDAWGYRLLGFAAWIGAQSRYQAVAIGLSVSLVVGLLALRRRVSSGALRMYAAGAGGALVLSAPFYIFNWLAFDNPVWPLMSASINGMQSYPDRMAAAFNNALHGPLRLHTLLQGVGRLLTSPEVFPIPLCSIVLLGIALRRRDRTVQTSAMVMAIFLALWALTQQKLYPRFSLMLTSPVLIGWAPVLGSWVRVPLLHRGIGIGLGLLWLGFAGVNLHYTIDYLHYAVTGDHATFHRDTWFYKVFDWANHHTPPNARFLVIVNSGQSYYLHRPLRRADPQFSGVVDWMAVQDAENLRQVLAEGSYDYMIYENRDWSRSLGGQHMSDVIAQAIAQGVVTPVATFNERLITSRLWRTGYTTTVAVLQRHP